VDAQAAVSWLAIAAGAVAAAALALVLVVDPCARAVICISPISRNLRPRFGIDTQDDDDRPEISMEANLRPAATIVDAQATVSWPAIAAGAVAAAVLALVLVAFGAGVGLSAISPWSDSGVSASTFRIGTGIYLIIISVMSSAVGGYLAARLRTRWTGVHNHEVFFRDTAHGFLAWAFAMLLSASALASTTAYLAKGGAASLGSAAVQGANPAEVYVDKLFRSDVASAAANPSAANAAPQNPANAGRAHDEVLWLLSVGLRENDLVLADRTYVARLVAAQAGLSQADAVKRVNDVIAEAKTAADNASKAAAKSFWLTAAMLFGAFAAGLAAVEGGSLRDGTWDDRVLTPRQI
jgi:hypothetical protein